MTGLDTRDQAVPDEAGDSLPHQGGGSRDTTVNQQGRVCFLASICDRERGIADAVASGITNSLLHFKLVLTSRPKKT